MSHLVSHPRLGRIFGAPDLSLAGRISLTVIRTKEEVVA